MNDWEREGIWVWVERKVGDWGGKKNNEDGGGGGVGKKKVNVNGKDRKEVKDGMEREMMKIYYMIR